MLPKSIVESPVIEELQGLYGPYHVSELVLQRIWLQGAFDDSRLTDASERRIQIEHPGKWNRLEGPDFKDARIRIEGELVEGDVEIHFAQADWKKHGHDLDPNYDKVVLHVVYHPVEVNDAMAMTSKGVSVPCASLMPLLWYSLEEYASEDSIVASAGTELSPAVEQLLSIGLDERRAKLSCSAQERWKAKARYARLRIDKLGWEQACHQSALEILGYSKNRVPMLALAERFRLEAFRKRGLSLDAMWNQGGDRWRTNGCRPANHPRLRLEQYSKWVLERPDWPKQLAALGTGLPQGEINNARLDIATARRSLGVSGIRKRINEVILASAIGGTRASTLVVDGFLPLLSARFDAELSALWFAWPAGDGPDAATEALKRLQIVEGRNAPMANGWLQAILGL